ncbi:MAG: Ig-like domain-containing protein [Gemmatimonadetes bacterium]|nr:Ig-like domain-containing protein [Gemmatimonadota bacterium]
MSLRALVRVRGARLTAAPLLLLVLTHAAAAQQPVPGGKPRLRWQYFHEQRAFPFEKIPPGALGRAREQLRARWPGPAPGAGGAAQAQQAAWTPLGPGAIPISLGSAGRLTAIAVHPTNSNIVFVGGAQGGVWKTTDGGATWTPLTDGECSLAMGALAIDPLNPSVVYAGTGEQHFSGDSYYGCGLLRSTDGGTTWTRLGASVFDLPSGGAKISRIVIDSSTAGGTATTTLYVASDFGLYKSTDGGATWTQVQAGIATDLVMDPTNRLVLYAALGNPFGGSGNGVYKTTDAGLTWTQLSVGFPASNVGRINLALARSAPAVLHAAVQDAFDGVGSDGGFLGLWKTTDGGASWSQAPASGASCAPQCWYDMFVAVHPNDPNTVYFGGVSLFKSTDGGNSFPSILNGIHVDQHAWAFDPQNPDIVFAGNDGGIYRSADAGASWTSLNNNLAITQFYAGISLHPTDTATILGGTQDNGTLQYAGVPTWQHVLGGDGGFTGIDFLDPTVSYAETQWTPPCGFCGPRRRQPPLASFQLVLNGIDTSDRGLFIPPLVMSPTKPQRLYFGTFRLYRTDNRGDAWAAISPDLTQGGGRISAIAEAPSDSLTIYVGTSNGLVQVTSDGGGSWTRITTNLPTRFVTAIALHPVDADVAYVTFSGFGSAHVFKTTDRGASWQSISGDLPDVPVNAFAHVSAELYVGTDLGVFRSMDGGASWTPFNDGMPNVAVFDLVYRPSLGTLVAATHGRGMFRTSVALAPVATVTITPASASLIVNESTRLTATPRDASGTPLVDRKVSWSSSAPSVASVDPEGGVSALSPGTAMITASSEGKSAFASIAVLPAATLIVTGTGLSAAAVLSERGTRLPLVAVRLAVQGAEAVEVRQLAFEVFGRDPLARLVLVRDVDGDRAPDVDEPLVADTLASLAGDTVRVTLAPDSLTVPADDSLALIAAVELSGRVPNETLFHGRFLPLETKTLGARSRIPDRISAGEPVPSVPVRTTVLRAGESFVLSENPVRSERVVFNFSERPKVAAVYTLTGRRVADLLARMSADGRAVWDLTNDEGGAVAPGVYLVVFDVAGRLVREKLLVIRPSGGEEEE